MKYIESTGNVLVWPVCAKRTEASTEMLHTLHILSFYFFLYPILPMIYNNNFWSTPSTLYLCKKKKVDVYSIAEPVQARAVSPARCPVRAKIPRRCCVTPYFGRWMVRHRPVWMTSHFLSQEHVCNQTKYSHQNFAQKRTSRWGFFFNKRKVVESRNTIQIFKVWTVLQQWTTAVCCSSLKPTPLRQAPLNET